MNIAPCIPCCASTTQTVNTPGPTGQSAVTTTSASFVIPAVGATVAINVGDTTWMKPFKNVFVSDGANVGNFIITAVNSSVQFTGKFLGFKGDTAAGATVASGAFVIPGAGDLTYPSDLDGLTALTDNSGGVASDTISANISRQTVLIGPFLASSFANTQLYEVALPFAFTVLSVLFRCVIAAITTGGKGATFTGRINGVNMTGGVITAAGTYALGATQNGTSISGANTGTAGQTIELLVSGVTAFTEGNAQLEFTVRNDDLNATIAAFASKLNTLRTNLRHI